MARSMGVSVEPGATTLHRIPCSASSSPRLLVNALAAALDAAYAVIPLRATRAALEAIVTIDPARRGIMYRATSRLRTKGARTLTSKVRAQSASENSTAAPVLSTPAPFTNEVIGPIRDSMSDTPTATAVSSVMSSTCPMMSSPSSAAYSTSCLMATSSTSTATTRSSRRANVVTTRDPTPPPAPVTTATMPTPLRWPAPY